MATKRTGGSLGCPRKIMGGGCLVLPEFAGGGCGAVGGILSAGWWEQKCITGTWILRRCAWRDWNSSFMPTTLMNTIRGIRN